MNQITEAITPETNLIKLPHMTYDLAEGPHARLKGSINQTTLPEVHEVLLFSLLQTPEGEAAMIPKQQLDTNVMYDPVSGEGLVCVNGRCISNKRRMQVHDERHIGLKSGNRIKAPPQTKKRIGGKSHNGIPPNPYETLS